MNFLILIIITASITCPKRCKFTMSNSNSNGKRGLKFQLFFNTKNETVDACGANKNGKFRNIYINCSSWNDGKLYNTQELIIAF